MNLRVLKDWLIFGVSASLLLASFAWSDEGVGNTNSCVRDSNYATMDCLRKKVPELRSKLNLTLEKLKVIYDDPSCSSLDECSAKKHALSLLYDGQERWVSDLQADGESLCREATSWDQKLCQLDFKVRKTEQRIKNLEKELVAAEGGQYGPVREPSSLKLNAAQKRQKR